MRYRHVYLLIVAVLFFFGGTGCTTLKKLPLPPTYDQTCQPSSTVYLDWATDETDLAKPGEIPSDPKEAVEKAKQFLEDQGIGIVEKVITGQDKLDRFTTTMPHYVYVKPGFWDQPLRAQAGTLWHEIVHVRQWQRLGRSEMGLRWTVYAEGRWSLETVAYRESFRSMKLFGSSDTFLRKYAPERAERFYTSYSLSGMDHDCMIQTTSEIWTMDLPAANTAPPSSATGSTDP